MPYLPNTDDVLRGMMESFGKKDFSELISAVPEEFRLNRKLDLPAPLSEYQLESVIGDLLKSSRSSKEMVSFAGGGSYDHFVPSIIGFLLSRSEFYTAYTPYQPEVSQGTLQAYFEFQSLICDLTKMEAANASMYDGSSGTAEAVFMAARLKQNKTIYVSATVHPHIRKVVDTYNSGINLDIQEIPEKDGRMDLDFLAGIPGDNTAAVVVQSPNYYGVLEDLPAIAEKIPENALFILNTDPVSLGILKKPGDLGVDILVSDGQSLGNGLCFGGPTCGIFATKLKYVRQMPGRIAGMTKDLEGRVGFVTTLQTREQHIRRAKATSNICTSQALNALATTIFLSVIGKEGLYQMAYQSLQKSHYLAEKICEIDGFELVYDQPYFKEFLIKTPVPAKVILRKGAEENFIAGIVPLRPVSENELLIAVTEKRTREEMDCFVDFLKKLS